MLPIFEGLCRIVKHVPNPSECTSAERGILIYLLDLYASCTLLKSKPPASETFFSIYPKVKQMLAAAAQPTPAACAYTEGFMLEIFMNPPRGGKIDPTWGRILNESLENRYSFVCNALLAISRETDNDRLNDISIMCAEFSAHCNTLSSEWLGAFIALCGSSDEVFYSQLLEHIDIQKVAIHNALAVFVSILVGKFRKSISSGIPSQGKSISSGITRVGFSILERLIGFLYPVVSSFPSNSSTVLLVGKVHLLRGTAGVGERMQRRTRDNRGC